jgi:hypothetical protein
MKPGKKKARLFDKYASTPTTKLSEFGKTKLKATYQLPSMFEVDMIWDGRNMRNEWTPDLPNSRTVTKKFWEAYKSAQDDFYTDVAALEGLGVVIFDGINPEPTIIEVPTKN